MFRTGIAPATTFAPAPIGFRSRANGWQVPERAVIRDQGNPIGEAVVWYVHHRGSIIISCFVPADAV